MEVPLQRSDPCRTNRYQINLTIVVDNDISTRIVIKWADDFDFFSLRVHKWHKVIRKEAICVRLLARRSPHDVNRLVTSPLSRFELAVEVLSDHRVPTLRIDRHQLSSKDAG